MNHVDYDNSIQKIPHLIRNILTEDSQAFNYLRDIKCNRVIFILVDSLGYNLFTHYLWELTKKGSVFKISSVFPSTTAAALTSIYSGLYPKEHGILEWFMYYEEFGDVIRTLPFSTRDSQVNDELLKRKLANDSIFELPSLTSSLNENGLNTYSFVSEKYAFSSYSKHMFRGSDIVQYKTYHDGFRKLSKLKDFNLAIIYIDIVDILSHKYGPSSPQVYTEIIHIKRGITELMRTVKDAVLIVSADHGHVDLRKITVNKELLCNDKLLPGGSPRDVFLYCQEAPELNDATVLSRDSILKNNLLGFGDEHPHLRERLANYVVLPENYAGMWFEKIEMKGAHGGLNDLELEVPLFIAEL